jgi:hypothetical protein
VRRRTGQDAQSPNAYLLHTAQARPQEFKVAEDACRQSTPDSCGQVYGDSIYRIVYLEAEEKPRCRYGNKPSYTTDITLSVSFVT